MKLTREDIWHIINIMEERGVGHCKFCKELLRKLKEEYEKSEEHE